MSAKIHIRLHSHSKLATPSLTGRKLLEFLLFSRRYVGSLKKSGLYWKAIICLVKVEAELLWPIHKTKLAEKYLSRVRQI